MVRGSRAGRKVNHKIPDALEIVEIGAGDSKSAVRLSTHFLGCQSLPWLKRGALRPPDRGCEISAPASDGGPCPSHVLGAERKKFAQSSVFPHVARRTDPQTWAKPHSHGQARFGLTSGAMRLNRRKVRAPDANSVVGLH
jgi:hypothetical protein